MPLDGATSLSISHCSPDSASSWEAERATPVYARTHVLEERHRFEVPEISARGGKPLAVLE